jgi:hypothetical protein
VQLRSPTHEIGAGGADLGAIEEQANVALVSPGQLAAEVIGGELEADAMAPGAVLDALVHRDPGVGVGGRHGGLRS